MSELLHSTLRQGHMLENHDSDEVTAAPDSGLRPVRASPDPTDGILFIADLHRHRKGSLLAILAGMMLALAVALLPGPDFVSLVRFIPEQSDQAGRVGGLLGLASQLGAGITNTEPTLYLDLLR